MGDEARQALDEKHCLKMLEHLPVAVLIAEVSGRPLYMNRSARNLLGMGLQDLDPEAGIGDLLKVFRAHVAGTNQLYPRERSPLAKALAGEISTVDDMEIRQQGQTIPLEVSASPIFDEKGEVAFAIAVFKDIADRKKEERDLSQRRNELERLIAKARAGRRRLQILSRKRIEVQEAERRGIARELHDEIGQALTAIKINLQAAMGVSETQSVEDYLKEGIEVVERVLQQVRNLSLDLRPSMLDDLGLMASLRWYLDRQSQTSGIKIEFIGDPSIKRLPQEIETTCYRIVQEALTNVLRHARTSRVHVKVAPVKKGLG
ncbi:MAG: PAS domain S-box protein, partial [Deltaproteobacteria bacterium]|nr:PAS domain S-box protein [Deltaproteobacteria bacterium]